MPFARPTLTELRAQSIEDITTSGVPGLTGLLRNAVLRVLAWAMAGLAYSVYGYADWIARMGVPFTAEDEFLYAWAALIGVYPKAASSASGSATFTGAADSVLPLGTPLRRPNGTTYETTTEASINTLGNVTVDVLALDVGADTNAAVGEAISITTSIAGVNAQGLVATALTGGADAETNEQLRARMLAKYRAPPQGGAVADYIEWATEVPGCTRAWCASEGAGGVIVWVMFDGNGNAAPAKTLLHQADPFHQRIGFVFQGGELGLGLVLDRKLQGRQSVFLIGPVDANNGSVGVQIKGALFCRGIVCIHILGFELSCLRRNPSTVKYLQWDLSAPLAKGSSGSE
jgi:uncharacterized phage protein gp47/JayE